MKKYLFILFTFIISQVAIAETSSLHHVELLIFANKDKEFDANLENLPGFIGKINLENAITIKNNEELEELSEFQLENSEDPIYLPGDKKQLKNEVYQLYKKLNKEIVYHKAWRQNLFLGKRTLPIYITGGDKFEGEDEEEKEKWELEGVIDIKKLRGFYHTKVDFIYNASRNSDEDIFRMKSHGRLKKSEIYYFDHPKFGALLLLTPLNS